MLYMFDVVFNTLHCTKDVQWKYILLILQSNVQFNTNMKLNVRNKLLADYMIQPVTNNSFRD